MQLNPERWGEDCKAAGKARTEKESRVLPLWGRPWHSTAVVNARCHPAREQERAGSGTKVAGDDNVPARRTRCRGLSALPRCREGRARGTKGDIIPCFRRDEWSIESHHLSE